MQVSTLMHICLRHMAHLENMKGFKLDAPGGVPEQVHHELEVGLVSHIAHHHLQVAALQ